MRGSSNDEMAAAPAGEKVAAERLRRDLPASFLDVTADEALLWQHIQDLIVTTSATLKLRETSRARVATRGAR